MSIVGSVVQGSGGGASDIKDTYTTLDAQTGNYTVINTGSTVIPVDTTGGSFTVTLDETIAEIGARFRVQDVGGYCATNPAYVEDSEANALQRVDTNDGAVEYVWTGLSWQIIDKFENMWDRNPGTGEITPASEDDVIVAGMMRAQSATATTVEKTVADATNIGANVDQNGVLDFGNVVSAATAHQINGNVASTSAVGYTWWAGGPVTNIYDNNTSTSAQIQNFNAGEYEEIMFTAPINLYNFKLVAGDDSGGDGHISGATLKYTIDGGSNWVDWDASLTGIASGATDNVSGTYIEGVDGIRFYWELTSASLYGYLKEIYIFDREYSATSNTSDISIPVGTYSAASIVYYDETDTLISGSGKINVAYEVDGGGFNTLEDQTAFQARSEITSTTAFKIRTQVVNAQRWSRFDILTSTTYVSVNNDGIDVNISGSPVASLGSVFKCPKMTEATRDLLTPAEGWIIYNSTTNKLNVYTGSAWEVITSA